MPRDASTRIRSTALLALLTCWAASPGHSQSTDDVARNFPAVEFHRRELIARWLLVYDRVAWITSDSAAAASPTEQQRLGPEWFAWLQDSTWHAFYGRYLSTEDRYDIGLHFTLDSDGIVRRSSVKVDTARATRFARVLHSSLPHVNPRVPSELRMNAYVRERENGEIEAWFLPAWQPNGFIVHGAQLMFTFDSTGRSLLDSTVMLTELRGARPDTTGMFSVYENDNSVPSVASIFLMLAYHPYFSHVYVYTQNFLSSYLPREGGVWIHAVRRLAHDSAPQ